MSLKNCSCPYFNADQDVESFIDIGRNIFVVLLNNGRIFVLKDWGFWGHVGDSTLRKGLYSNREYDLSDRQIAACIEAKAKLLE